MDKESLASMLAEEVFYLVPLRLAEHVPAEDFETFMREDVFPAIPKNQTRVGQVTRLRLIQGNNNSYLWLIYGTINDTFARQQMDRIKAFGADELADGVSAGIYRDVVTWTADEKDLAL